MVDYGVILTYGMRNRKGFSRRASPIASFHLVNTGRHHQTDCFQGYPQRLQSLCRR